MKKTRSSSGLTHQQWKNSSGCGTPAASPLSVIHSSHRYSVDVEWLQWLLLRTVWIDRWWRLTPEDGRTCHGGAEPRAPHSWSNAPQGKQNILERVTARDTSCPLTSYLAVPYCDGQRPPGLVEQRPRWHNELISGLTKND